MFLAEHVPEIVEGSSVGTAAISLVRRDHLESHMLQEHGGEVHKHSVASLWKANLLLLSFGLLHLRRYEIFQLRELREKIIMPTRSWHCRTDMQESSRDKSPCRMLVNLAHMHER